MTAFIDTNVLIRHLIGEPADQAKQATRTLSSLETLLLSDIVIAEAIYVLQKVYSVDRPTISDVMKSLIASRRSRSLTNRQCCEHLKSS